MIKPQGLGEAEDDGIASPTDATRSPSAEKRQGAVLDEQQALVVAPTPQFFHRLLPSKVMSEINRPGATGSPGDQIRQIDFTAPGNPIADNPCAGVPHRVEFRAAVVGGNQDLMSRANAEQATGERHRRSPAKRADHRAAQQLRP